MLEQLGYQSGDRLLIINADDCGITSGSNRAIIDLLEQGGITSTSIMMPCSVASEAAQTCVRKQINHVGVHLTLTSDEFAGYKPVLQPDNRNSLSDGDGYFHRDPSYVERHADPDDVRKELDAQIRLAIAEGLDPTHLDSHAGSVLGLAHGRDFLDVVFDLCERYRLPFNLPLRISEQPFFSNEQKNRFKQRTDEARRRGILLIDDMVGLPYSLDDGEQYEDVKSRLCTMIRNLHPGITHLTTHPAIVTEELKAITPHYRAREWEYRMLTAPDIKALLRDEGVQLVSWRAIRDLQRKMA